MTHVSAACCFVVVWVSHWFFTVLHVTEARQPNRHVKPEHKLYLGTLMWSFHSRYENSLSSAVFSSHFNSTVLSNDPQLSALTGGGSWKTESSPKHGSSGLSVTPSPACVASLLTPNTKAERCFQPCHLVWGSLCLAEGSPWFWGQTLLHERGLSPSQTLLLSARANKYLPYTRESRQEKHLRNIVNSCPEIWLTLHSYKQSHINNEIHIEPFKCLS